MTQHQEGLLSPEIVLEQLKQNGVTHVVWLPDSETNFLYLLMEADPSLDLIPVSREGQAFSTAAGLAVGGKRPVILIQNTGLMESGDSLRGWAMGLNIPVVLMVGYRGWTRHGVNTDTAATYTERFLNAFGINYYLVENGEDAPRISVAFEEARKNKRPVAVLVGDEYTASIAREPAERLPGPQLMPGEKEMIQTADMLRVFQEYRGDAIVIPGRGGRHWVNISTKPDRDLPLGDPAMGGHASFALGLALAMPDQKVVLFDSEGDILMNLGALPTIAEKEPKNLYHFVLDNEVYATTGGQPVPNAKNVRYEVIADGSGYPSTFAFDNLEDFTNNIQEIMNRPGPVFVTMKVVPEIENEPIGSRRRWQTRTRTQAVEDFQKEFGIADE